MRQKSESHFTFENLVYARKLEGHFKKEVKHAEVEFLQVLDVTDKLLENQKSITFFSVAVKNIV